VIEAVQVKTFRIRSCKYGVPDLKTLSFAFKELPFASQLYKLFFYLWTHCACRKVKTPNLKKLVLGLVVQL